MKRKLITKLEGHHCVVCDNPSCGFEIKYNECGLKIEDLINVACPDCGENLLTEKDYTDYMQLMRVVDWINKWFSWITVFYSRKTLQNQSKASVKVHDGIISIKPIKQNNPRV